MQNEERENVLETQSSTQKRILLTLRDIKPEINKIYWMLWRQNLGLFLIIILLALQLGYAIGYYNN